VQVNTGAAGDINLVFGDTPFLLNKWTQWSAIYHQYLTLSMKVEYEPTLVTGYDGVVAANNLIWRYRPMITATDRGTSATLGTYPAAAAHESARQTNSGKKWTRVIQMSGAEDALWIPTASATSSYYVKMYSNDNLPLSAFFGSCFITLLLEFRAHT